MTVSLKHAFQSAVPDNGDPNEVGPNEWNAEHVLTQAADRILGRVTAGDGETEELTAAEARTLLNVEDGATANSPDATLLDRANHTGTQTLATISDAGTAAAADTGDFATAAQAVPAGGTTGQALVKASNADNDVEWATVSSGGAVDSVNGQTGTVVLDPDDLDDTSTTHKFVSATDLSDIAANTAARHAAVTVTDSAEIDFTLTGQDITASLKAGSIDETKLDASVNASLDLADSAVQPGDLATVATSGAYSDLSGTPTLGTAAAADTTDFATAAQGSLADSAVQPGDLGGAALLNVGTGAGTVAAGDDARFHSAVTLAGTPDYITLSGQQLTLGQIDLTADVTGDLPFANLAQGSALSVLGVTGNATADVASIAAGTDHQVLRRSGTSLGFGAVNLGQSAAVTGTLPVGNLPIASQAQAEAGTDTATVMTPQRVSQAITALAGGGGQPIPTDSTYAVGTMMLGLNDSGSSVSNGNTIAGSSLKRGGNGTSSSVQGGQAVTGTWKNITGATCNAGAFGVWVRTA